MQLALVKEEKCLLWRHFSHSIIEFNNFTYQGDFPFFSLLFLTTNNQIHSRQGKGQAGDCVLSMAILSTPENNRAQRGGMLSMNHSKQGSFINFSNGFFFSFTLGIGEVKMHNPQMHLKSNMWLGKYWRLGLL